MKRTRTTPKPPAPKFTITSTRTAGSLNYLKVKADGGWAWTPLLIDNPVGKVEAYLDVMARIGTKPEFECFDTGIVRCIDMYVKNGMYKGRPQYNFVMGVETG